MNTIQFKPVTGAILLEKFGKHECESDIEYAYKFTFIEVCNNKMQITKSGFSGTKARTDGVMMFPIVEGRWLMGLQETKYNKRCTPIALREQLAQALHYNYLTYTQDDLNREYDYFILNSESFLCYVLRKDVEKLIANLDPLFEKTDKCPSKVWSDDSIKQLLKDTDIPFHIFKVSEEMEINKILAEIFNQIK